MKSKKVVAKCQPMQILIYSLCSKFMLINVAKKTLIKIKGGNIFSGNLYF